MIPFIIIVTIRYFKRNIHNLHMSAGEAEEVFTDKPCPSCGKRGSLVKVEEPTWLMQDDESTYVWATAIQCKRCNKKFYANTISMREIPVPPPAYP